MGKQSGNPGPDPGEGGRPTKYDVSFNDLAFNYGLLGAKDEDIARFLGVDEATINRWKHKYPDFCESLKNGREGSLQKVVRSQFERATGYKYQETKEVYETDEKGVQVLVKKEVVTKQQAPDVGAQCFILKNRAKKYGWADKHELDLSGSLQVNFDPEDSDLA